MLSDDEVQRALVVVAHPDDADFGSAGTIAAWTKVGIAVTYCIATSGDAGGFDAATPREQIPIMRQAEQRAAAAEVGVSDVRFLDHRDGAVVAGPDLVRDIARVIRQVRPQRVLTQSPERNYRRLPASHPDHRAVGAAALDAVYPAARNPYAFPELLADEGLTDWVVPEVWLGAHPTADHYVDITDTFDRKLAALRAHTSQTGHMDDLEGLLRGWLGANARSAGLPAGRLAESFFVITV
ncbi:MAG TPA: PIG-L deacetylase family protein [Mycobacteriales bacterium]|nr:PIG-L deacetylase family protein [Mycobacteriales bacterium]